SLQDIQKELAAGLLSPDQAGLAQLRARKTFLEQQPAEKAGLGARPDFLEQGTAAAFSASLSRRGGVDKTQGKILQTDEAIRKAVESIDKKSGTSFPIPA
ncbi:MAG TPA: hypothetical protein VKH44_06460, partial [Pirellulaceae bacterium]|nr:hypothetical protein [Pirellulaceae bacterium]